MSSGAKLGFTGVVVVVLATAVLRFASSETGDGAKHDLIAEIQQWERCREFDDMLMQVIDLEHERIFEANYRKRRLRRPAQFDELSYRSMMYRAMRQALTEAGADDAAVELDQYRVRINDRR